MSKKIIGSRQAAELARKEFGPKAYVKRCEKMFLVGISGMSFWGPFPMYEQVKGRGKSWAEALQNAGITLPIEATIAGEVHAALFADPKLSDSLPTDTDAKDPDYGNE